MPEAQSNIKPATSSVADQRIKEYEQGVSKRRNFESYWQTLHDYWYIEAQNLNKTYSVGNELSVDFLWDSTTLETGDVFASGFMNYLTPPTARWSRLKPKNKAFSTNKAVGNFLEDVMAVVSNTLNGSNFYDQMFPAYKSSGIFGTSFLFEEEDEKEDVRFYNMPLKQTIIVEDARSRVNKYYIEFEYTGNQAASRWGVEALSPEMQREITEGKGDGEKHKFILYIAERTVREIQKTDKKNMPIEGTWIDVKGRLIVEESGYHEMPAFTHRFDKRPFLEWGFSPAMKALPFARMLNTIAKTNLSTMMKHNAPAVAIPNNAFIAPFNQNPDAINYYSKNKMDSAKDIFTFGNYGDPQTGMTAIEYYSGQVKSLMFTDVFLAFSNITKDMNNPEIMERINEKMTMLGPAVGRYLQDVISPVIHRTIGILARRGKLPDPPIEFMMDPGYEAEFIGVLAQAQRRTELNSLVTGLTMVGNLAQFEPSVKDKIDPDKVVDEVWGITGAPVKVLRDDNEMQQIREARAEEMLRQQELAEVGAGAAVAKDAGKAEADFAKAKQTNTGVVK